MSTSVGDILMQVNSRQISINPVLLVVLFCYLPHLTSLPVLSVFIIVAMAYRLLAQYKFVPLPKPWIRSILIILSLGLLYWQYRVLQASGFYIGCLLVFTGLKTLEAETIRDLRVLVLCNFYVILTVLLLHQELWVFLYIVIAVIANLILLVKLTAPQVDFSYTGKRFVKHFLLALPISLFLFYLFPRLSHPLWHVPSLSQTKTGFNEEMTVRNISEIFTDDSTVMRVVFNKKFKPTLYWRGLVLSNYNGISWKPATEDDNNLQELPLIENEAARSYEIMLEPHQKKWLFYQDNPIAANPKLLFSSKIGLVQQNNSPVYYRLSYSITDKLPIYQPITQSARQKNTLLPKYGSQKLKAWAKEQFAAVNKNPQLFIASIARKINQENYWYSLVPETIGNPVNLLDKFWFETKRGYCEYYTGAVAIILRAAGIPARVIIGYHGGKWNPVAQYLTVQQNDAHAWLEYWQEGFGWQRLDPVSFIDLKRIDPAIHQKQQDEATQGWLEQSGNTLSWFSQASFFLESVQFFWERWLLFYNQETQQDLLEKLGLAQWDGIKLLQVCIIFIVVFLILTSLWYFWQQHREKDPLLAAYHRLQNKLARMGIETQPPATFVQQLQALEERRPELKELLRGSSENYEKLRLQHGEERIEDRKAVLRGIKRVIKLIGRERG